MYRYKSVLFCLNLLNYIFSLNSNKSFCCNNENPSEKHIWSKFERNFGSKTYSTQVHHLLSNHFQFKIEYGINQRFLVDLVDNVRCNSRWIKIAIGLNCVGGLGSYQGFKIVNILEVQHRGSEVISWTFVAGVFGSKTVQDWNVGIRGRSFARCWGCIAQFALDSI